MRYVMFVACIYLIVGGIFVQSSYSSQNPIEIGTIDWGRDLESAKIKSRETGKPIFLLFQEVPGCLGCKDFGREVLSYPLSVTRSPDNR